VSKRITAGEAEELYADGEGENGDVVGDWTLVGGSFDHKHRESRWHQRYWLLVRNKQGQIYGVDFGIGLTEDQEDEFPWRGRPDDHGLSMTRLHPHTVTRVEYRSTPVEATGGAA
jgi:hypothetical protein